MNSNYTILLFKNKERYKIIKNYKTYGNAITYYNKKIHESNSIIFDVQTENGRNVDYEIALVEKTSDKLFPIYRTDELGRNIPVLVDDKNFAIIKIEKFNIPETVYHVDSKKKLYSNEIISKFFKTDSVKLVSKLNNKVVVQDDDKVNLFSFKSIHDSNRFLDNLEIHLKEINMRNCLIVRDTSIEQKKYMYSILTDLGYNKKMLYRTSTTHLKDK